MRIIAQRCLYGVDINPLATEMAKLSLWLLTLARDKPFEFLDHAIRCGDSLVGLHDIEQLRHFSLKPDSDDAVLFGGPFEEAVEEAIALRLKLEEMPANTVEDVAAQEKLLREAEDRIARLRCAADLLVAAEFWGEGTKDKQERVRHAAVVAGHYVENGPTDEFEEVARKEWRVAKDGTPLTTHHSPHTTRPFHWPLEFPEVIVKRGGFDTFVGNPPFLGGTRISTTLGVAYLDFLYAIHGRGNRADLCAYFFRQAARLLDVFGFTGLLATNTIAQGDTRNQGLAHIVDAGGALVSAVSSLRWPGKASLQIAMIVFAKREWNGACNLDGLHAPSIDSYLGTNKVALLPYRLASATARCFQGSKIYGKGFLLTPDEARAHTQSHPFESSVIRPYLDGRDLNAHPRHLPTRFVVDFREWTEEQCRRFPAAFAIVEQRVRPERLRSTYSDLKDYWWRFQRTRREMYDAITGLQRVIVTARVSSTNGVAFVPTNMVLNEKLVVFPFDDHFSFSVLQCGLHWEWAWQFGSTLKQDLNYSTTDVFETLVWPSHSDTAQNAGRAYDECRSNVMTTRGEGLTKTYNRVSTPGESSTDIQTLRDLHVEMDQAVAAAYGWDDLDLGHGFHETKQGIRFTISEPARREVLQRLLKLNHERYEEEVRQGLHDKKKRGSGSGKRDSGKRGAAKKQKKAPPAGPSLFPDDDAEGG